MMRKRKNTILILGHFSNWEGMLTIGSHLIGNSYGIYTPLTNKFLKKMKNLGKNADLFYCLGIKHTILLINEEFKRLWFIWFHW